MKKHTEFFEVIATDKQTGKTSRFLVTERWEITSIEKQNQDCNVSYNKA